MKAPSLARLLFALSIAAALPAAGAGPAQKASAFYEDALVRFEKNDLAGAVIQLRNALQQDPKLLAAHVLLGKALLRQGEAGSAEVALNQAIRLGVAPSEVAVPLAQAWFDQGKYQHLLANATGENLPGRQRLEILLLRAGAQAELRNFTESAAILEEARRIEPGSGPVAVSQAMLMLHSGRLQAAARFSDEAVRLAPGDAQAWYARGAVQHVMGNAQGSLEAYSAALKLAAGHLDARVARAGLLLDLKRDGEAAQDLAELRKLHPLEPRSNYLNAVLAAKQGRQRESRALLAEVTRFIDPIAPDMLARKPQLLLLGGLAHHGLGQPEKAKAAFENYIKQNPRHAGARKLLASILLGEGNATQALSVLEPAEKLAPGDPQVLSLLASANGARGRHQKAAEYLERAVAVGAATPALETSLGFSLMSAGRADTAMEQLQRVWRKDPGQARAGYALAIMHMKQGQAKKAVEIAGQMAGREPKNPVVHNLLAVARAAASDLKGARAAYEAALALDKDFLPARLNLGKLDLAEGRTQAARSRFQAIVQQHPKHTRAMFELALAEEAAGNRAGAVEWLEKIRAIDRKDVRAGTRLVDWRLSEGKVEKALALAKEMDSLTPDDMAVLAALGRANVAAGLPKSARAIFDRMTVLAQYDPAAQVRIAALQLSAGNTAGAAYSLEKALSAKADYLPAQAMLAEVELRQGEIGKAEQRAKSIATGHPALAIGQRLLGDVGLARKQYAEAIGAYRAALAKESSPDTAARLLHAFVLSGNVAKGIEALEGWARANPREPMGPRLLSEAHLRAGDYKAARATLEKAIRQQGEDAGLLNNLAYAMNKLGDAGALAVAEKAYRLAPDQPDILDTYGWSLVGQGQLESGLRHLRDARLRNPNNAEIRYHLAAALAKAGRREEARQELAQALKPGVVVMESAAQARKLMQQLSGS
ncbi:MAG: hypothetical protein Fur0039_04790 [Rhodocyclaceae bacterium]